MTDDANDSAGPDRSGLGDLASPFLFVPHGAPEPTEWMRKHPGWVKFPATFVPRAPAAVRTIPGTNRPWPLDKRGQPWPRSRFGQPLRPLDEYPPGVRAPGEGYEGPIADPQKAVESYIDSKDLWDNPGKYVPSTSELIQAYLSAEDVWKNPGKYAGYPRPASPSQLVSARLPGGGPQPKTPRMGAEPEVVQVVGPAAAIQGALGAAAAAAAALEASRVARSRTPRPPPTPPRPPGIGGPTDVLPGLAPEAMGGGGVVTPVPEPLPSLPGLTPLPDASRRWLDRPEGYTGGENTGGAIKPGEGGFTPAQPGPNILSGTPADKMSVPDIWTMSQNTSRPHLPTQDADDWSRAQQLGYTRDQYDDLARDPDHAGQVKDSTRWERSSLLEAQELGLITGPLRRGPRETDAIDGAGQIWDVKSFDSRFPPRQGGFTPARGVRSVEDELSKGHHVLVETRWMKPADLQALKGEAITREWGDRVRILER